MKSGHFVESNPMSFWRGKKPSCQFLRCSYISFCICPLCANKEEITHLCQVVRDQYRQSEGVYALVRQCDPVWTISIPNCKLCRELRREGKKMGLRGFEPRSGGPEPPMIPDYTTAPRYIRPQRLLIKAFGALFHGRRTSSCSLALIIPVI